MFSMCESSPGSHLTFHHLSQLCENDFLRSDLISFLWSYD